VSRLKSAESEPGLSRGVQQRQGAARKGQTLPSALISRERGYRFLLTIIPIAAVIAAI